MAEALKQKKTKTDKQAIRQYLKEVRKTLTCPMSVKSVFLGELKNTVLEYAGGKENITVEMLCAEFGSPTEIADGFLERSDYQKLLQKAKKKLRIWRVVSAILAVSVVLVILYLIYLCSEMGGAYTITDRPV